MTPEPSIRPVGGKSRQRGAERPPNARTDEVRRLRDRLGDEYRFTPHLVRHKPAKDRGGPPEGSWVHFVDEGNPGADPVLFVHGNPTWSFAYRALIRRFRRTHRCVAVDQLGCGFSDKPRDFEYTLRAQIEVLEFVVEELGLGRITLVVHDWGGPIGLGFARRHPDLVARIVILNTAAFPFGELPAVLRLCRVPGLGALLVRGLGLFSRGLLRYGSATGKRFSKEERRGYLLPYASWGDRVAVHEFVKDIPMGDGHRSWPELVAVGNALPDLGKRPTQIVWGERDFVFTKAVLAEFEQRLPGAEVVRLPRAGHLLLEDAPEEVGDAIEAFLGAHPLPERGAAERATAE